MEVVLNSFFTPHMSIAHVPAGSFSSLDPPKAMFATRKLQFIDKTHILTSISLPLISTTLKLSL